MKTINIDVGEITLKKLQSLAKTYGISLEMSLSPAGYGCVIFCRQTSEKELLYMATFPAQLHNGRVILYFHPSFCSERRRIRSFENLPILFREFLDDIDNHLL